MGRAMCLHIAGVDRCGLAQHPRRHQGLEDVHPDPPSRPAIEAIVDRGVRPVLGRAVTPPATGFENVKDAADHAAIVNPPRTGLVLWQVRVDRRPCIVA